MISPRGAEVLSLHATDLLTIHGTNVDLLDDAELRQHLAGMTDSQAPGFESEPLFDHQLDDAVKLLRCLFGAAVHDVSWRPGAIEALRVM